MKHTRFYFSILAFWSLCAFLLRFWNLHAAVDQLGLFISGHPSTVLLLTVSGFTVAILLVLSHRSPGRGTGHTVLTFDSTGSGFSFAGAILMLLGVLLEGLSGSRDIWDWCLLLLGLLGTASMLMLSKLRRTGNRIPLWELLPVLYLLLKLICNFKSWSTDPVIMDYCIELLALSFSLLAVYGIAGFCFDLGRPRKTLFFSSCGIFFSAAALADGISAGLFSTICWDLGLILWLLPVVSCLLRPQAPSTPVITE